MKRLYLLLVSIGIASGVWAQDRTVSGSVTAAEDGSLLPGVNVVLKGTTQGTTTDVNGAYSISVPGPDAILQFSFTGRVTQDVTVGTNAAGTGTIQINIALAPSTQELKEVVVTALGIERETRTLGYASQQVGGAELTGSREANVVQGLAAKVAGVQIIQSAGTPGASSKIVMRGNRSFTGDNQPLFVIDGVPMDNQTASTSGDDYPFNPNLEQVPYSNRALDINPNDVESINVLKGPSAAALYGVRGANGAIIITTKKGRKGQPTQITYSTSVDVSQVNKLPDFQNVYAQGKPSNGQTGAFVDGETNPSTNQSYGPKVSDLIAQGKDVKIYDNVKKFFQTAVTTRNDVAITSGNDKSSYRLSLGQLSQNGIVPGTYYERYTARLTATSQLAKTVSISTTLNYVNSNSQLAQQGSNATGISLGLFRAPITYNLAGPYENPDGTSKNYFAGYNSPYWSANKNKFYSQNDRIIGNFTLKWELNDWLFLTYRPGVDAYTDSRNGHYAVGSFASETTTGQVTLNTITHKEMYQDVLLTSTHKLTEKLTGNITLGNNLDQRTDDSELGRGRSLAIPDFYNLSNASDRYASNSHIRRRSAAFFYDATISLNSFIYLNTTGRYEYSSTFGPNRRSFFFPAGNASLILTDLPGIKESAITKVVNFAKLRGGTAIAANTPNAYVSRSYYSQPLFSDGFTNGLNFPYTIGGNPINGFGRTNVLGNPNLKPEFTTSNEIGLELRFLNNRVTVDATYYKSLTTDALLQRPVPYSSGFAAKWDNAGKIENKGIELVLNARVVQVKDFHWDLTVNYTRNRNKVTALAPGVSQLELETGFGDPGAYAVVGQPYGELFGTYWLRDAKTGKKLIGDDGYPIKSTDTKALGSAFPNYTVGIRNSFTYKNVTVSALIDIRNGGKIWNGTQARLNRIGTGGQTINRDKPVVVDGIRQSDGQPNTTSITGINYYTRVASDQGATEEYIQDGGWVRLRELSITYSFKNVGIKAFKGIDVSLTGRNLWLQTKYQGVDPETSLTGAGSNINGFDYFNMPNTKSYSASVRFIF